MRKLLLVMTVLMSPAAKAGFTKCCTAEKILNLHTKNCIHSNNMIADFAVNVTHMPEMETAEETFVFKEVPSTDKYQCTQSLRYLFEFIIVTAASNYYIIDPNRPAKFASTDACIDQALNTKTSELSLVAQACLICEEDEPCVNYCCPDGQISRDGQCVQDLTKTNYFTQRNHKKVSLGLHCNKSKIYQKKLWDLHSNGSMHVEGVARNASEYCIRLEEECEPLLFLCAMDNEPTDYKNIFKLVFMCLSMGSILVIIFFHVMIEDLWLNRFTKLKIPLYICLFISFLVIVITRLNDFTGTSGCVILALTLQYFSLAIFFWLTSMSFDIWLGFRIIANPLQNMDIASAQQRSRMRVLYVFSVCGPLVITGVTAILQFLSDPEDSPYIHPSIGLSCELGQYLPRFLYFHMIIFTLLCINTIFYCLVVFNFTCGIWNQFKYSKNQLRNFIILIELIFLMGINWIAEIVTFFIGWQYANYWDHALLAFINSINWIIGVFIILLFFLKQTNRNLVKKFFLNEERDLDYNLARTFSTQLSEQELIQG